MLDSFIQQVERKGLYYTSADNTLTIEIGKGKNATLPLIGVVVVEKRSQWKSKIGREIFQPIFIIVKSSYGYDLYLSCFSPYHGKRIEYDIILKAKETDIKKFISKVINFIGEHYTEIEWFTTPIFKDYIEKLIDREKRVKEAGLLIAAYIKYLEKMEIKLRNVIKDGWGKIVLQLMVMYYLHRKAEEENLNKLKFEVIEILRDTKKREEVKKEGYEIWYILKNDLERLSKITKDLIFSVNDWGKLNNKGIKIRNGIFLKNDYEFLQGLRYENIRAKIKKLREALGKEKEFERATKALISDLEKLGILELFEIRSWYEAELIGDIIGGVYEGIKKLEERKKGGIYYTPRFIVEYVVNNAIESYLIDKIKEIIGKRQDFDKFIREANEEQLIKFYNDVLVKIRILDPACGTGHFLIYAMKKLALYYKKIKEIATEKDLHNFEIEYIENEKRKRRKLKDIDDKEFDFLLRQHFILKNNIFGVDIDREAHLIAKARLLLEVFTYYNREIEKKYYTYPNLEMNIKEGNSLIGFADTRELKETVQHTLTDFFKDKKLVEKIEQLKMETLNKQDIEKDLQKIKDFLDQKFKNILIREEIPKIWVEKLNNKIKEYYVENYKITLKEAKKFIDEYVCNKRIFHWIVEFPFLVNEKGFDIIVGNPPWEIVKPSDKEFFVKYDSRLTKYNLNAKEAKRIIKNLLKNPKIKEKWEDFLKSIFLEMSIYDHEKFYKNQGKGDINTYKLFIERCFSLLKNGGIFSMIVPAAFHVDEGSQHLRVLLFDNSQVSFLYSFENRKKLFDEIDIRYRYLIFSTKKGGTTENFYARFMMTEPAELEELPEKAIIINWKKIKEWFPNSYSIPAISNQLAITILEKMFSYPKMFQNKWLGEIKLVREFDMRNDIDLFNQEKKGLPVYEGKIIEQYNPFFAGPNYWVERKIVEMKMKKKKGIWEKDYQEYRIAIRAVASSTNRRTLICSLLPKNVACGNSLLVFRRKDKSGRETLTEDKMLYLCAILNSFVVDYLIRQYVRENLNMFFIYQIPVPPIDEEKMAKIIKNVLKLTEDWPEFGELRKKYGIKGKPLTKDERVKIIAEIDIEIAKAYGISAEQLKYILSTFIYGKEEELRELEKLKGEIINILEKTMK
ncbi:MAG TPA: hypothetical protein ENI52_05385 [Thermoplasmata archaeon]|nr:hypothetical protein [Thermoplasmata archaeon]